MSVSMRLRRFGRNKKPQYRLVVVDSRRTGAGRRLEDLGTYDPLTDPPKINIMEERVKYWIDQGAVPSETVRSILRRVAAQTKK